MDWDAMAGPWLSVESEIEAAHQAVLDGLMARAALRPGQRVLDIGCGMGMSLLAAAGAVGPAGRVTGVDIAPPMTARARERAPEHVEVVTADAGVERFAADGHDAIISLFGTMFFDDTVAGFTNLRNAVTEGAGMTLAAWGAPPRNPWFGIGRAAVEGALGPQPRPDPTAPGPFRFADAAKVLDQLDKAGWDASVETAQVVLRPRGTGADVAALQMVVGSAPMLLKEVDAPEAVHDAIRAAMTQAFDALLRDGSVQVPAEIHYFTASARA